MQQSKRMFVAILGIQRKSAKAFRYVLSKYKNGFLEQTEPEDITDKRLSYLTEHRAILLCLKKLLLEQSRGRGNKKILFCSLNNEIVFEWMTEYKNDGCFGKQTCDRDVWNEIAEIVKKEKITLSIKGTDSPLGGLAKATATKL